MYSSTADQMKLQENSRCKQYVVAVKSSLALGTPSIVTAVNSSFALRKMFHAGAYIQVHMIIVGSTAPSAV